MPRSLKKTPFVAYHLLKKINQLNKEGKKDTKYSKMSQPVSYCFMWFRYNF